MEINWNEIKWLFEVDGSLRDIYIQDTDISDWEKTIRFLNKDYYLKYDTHQIEPKYNQINETEVLSFLRDETGEVELKGTTIFIEKIRINCHFFLEGEIEFDIDPKEINNIQNFYLLERFMRDISKALQKQVTLTYETDVTFPLIKIDINKSINQIITPQELESLTGRDNWFINTYRFLKIHILYKLFRKRLQTKLLNSAMQPHVATPKSENIW